MCEPKAKVALHVPVRAAAGVVALAAAAGVALAAPDAAVALSVTVLAVCLGAAVLTVRFIARSRAGFGVLVRQSVPLRAELSQAAIEGRPPVLALPAARPVVEGVVVPRERVRARG